MQIDKREHKSVTIKSGNVEGSVDVGFFGAMDTNVGWSIRLKDKRQIEYRPTDSITIAEGKSTKSFDEVVEIVKTQVEQLAETIASFNQLAI